MPEDPPTAGIRDPLDAFERARRLLRYDVWAGDRLEEACGGAVADDPTAVRLLAHVAGAARVWLQRVRGRAWDAAMVWPDWSPGRTGAERRALAAEWPARLDEERRHGAGGERIVVYRNSRGEERRMGVLDIVQHVVNHGTHHRAQVLTRLKAAGREVPVIDYAYCPEVAVEGPPGRGGGGA